MQELLECCRAGEEKAIAMLVNRFQARALDLAEALLHDTHLAEDAVQQAFLTALRRLDDLREPKAFPGWFRQVVRSQCTDIRRRRKELPEAVERGEMAAVDISPGEHAQLADLRRLIERAIRELPVMHRRTSELFYLEERSCAEVGIDMGIPEGTVKRRLHESRERLRAILLGYIGDAPGAIEDRNDADWSRLL